MTYREAEKKMNRTLVLLLFSFLSFLSTMLVNLRWMGRESAQDAALWWTLNAFLLVLTAVLFWFFSSRARLCGDIKKQWEHILDDINTFVFVALKGVRYKQARLILHIWKTNSGRKTCNTWSKFEVEAAARAYPDGLETFYHDLLGVIEDGLLEFPEDRYHRLAVGVSLQKIVHQLYPLADFSSDAPAPADVIAQAVEAIMKA